MRVSRSKNSKLLELCKQLYYCLRALYVRVVTDAIQGNDRQTKVGQTLG